MDQDDLREHIELAACGTQPAARRAATWLLLSCWPGGTEDRAHTSALKWLARWNPERLGAPLPVCSCASGRCAVCN